MTEITGFRCVDNAEEDVPCDAFGNYVAYDCPKCGSPLLAILLDKQRGSNAKYPTECRCGLLTWITVDSTINKVLRLNFWNQYITGRLM